MTRAYPGDMSRSRDFPHTAPRRYRPAARYRASVNRRSAVTRSSRDCRSPACGTILSRARTPVLLRFASSVQCLEEHVVPVFAINASRVHWGHSQPNPVTDDAAQQRGIRVGFRVLPFIQPDRKWRNEPHRHQASRRTPRPPSPDWWAAGAGVALGEQRCHLTPEPAVHWRTIPRPARPGSGPRPKPGALVRAGGCSLEKQGAYADLAERTRRGRVERRAVESKALVLGGSESPPRSPASVPSPPT